MVDNNHHASSSSVAAGIINPVTGHRLNITAGFEQFLPPAKALYGEMEKIFDGVIFTPVEQLRLIKNKGQLEYLQRRQGQNEYSGILGNHQQGSPYFGTSEYGSLNIQQSAIVHCKEMLSSCRRWLQAQDAYLNAKLKYKDISATSTGVSYKDFKADGIIFCEGHAASQNPWLSELPFKLAKGDILTLQVKSEPQRALPMLNWGKWLAPTAKQGVVKLGSSFEWADLSLTPDPATHEKLIDSLYGYTNIRGEVIEREVGIRPTTRERQPFVGKMKNLEQAYCFNGFGSKGCLLMPFYANLLCDHLINDAPLPEEVTKWL